MDCAWITAMRTGASVGIAARYLARRESETAAIVGCGVQARTSLRALVEELPALAEVRCYDIDRAANDALHRGDGRAVPGAAVRDLPLRAGGRARRRRGRHGHPDRRRSRSPNWTPACSSRGALAVALDYDADWTGAAMRECDAFFSDDVEQLLATQGSRRVLRRRPGRGARRTSARSRLD